MAENQNQNQTVKLHDRIKTLRNALNSELYEKDEAIRLSLLTAIAGESIFFLGAPGSAKSMIARRIVKAFKIDSDVGGDSVKYFETLLNKFSTPEDVFGNISLKALNGELPDENGKTGKEEYRRLTENMLPEADIAFLDEIWKASPAILNTLLTIINERKFHNGSKVVDVPLKALFTASNELPPKNLSLEALYDRLILRLKVGYVQNEDNFFDMIESSSKEFTLPENLKSLQISNAELNAWKSKIDEVNLSEQARAVISAIRNELKLRNSQMSDEDKKNGETFEVSDRRWKKIMHILRTSAFLNDRTSVDLMDCQLIEYCIWSTEKQQKLSREIVEKCIKQNGIDCDSSIEDINEQIENFKNLVTETWFDLVKEKATEKIITLDGQKCYECTRDDTKEICYVSVEEGKNSYYNDRHDIYNSKKQYLRNYTFSKNGDKINCYDNFTINKNPAKSYLTPKKFSDIAQETLQKKFKSEHYAPIFNNIESEIKNLKLQKQKDEIPFRENLFANQEYNTSITSKINDAIKELQDAEINLDKEQSRYFKAEFSAVFKVGDVVLSDGTVFDSDEIKSLTNEQKENALGVICVSEKEVYAISLDEENKDWDFLKNYALHYGENFAKKYSSDWKVPNKDLLNEIWKNREIINKSFVVLNSKIPLLENKEYWSATADNNSAFYQIFDDEGKQDHTTKDHNYAVRLVRKWSKS